MSSGHASDLDEETEAHPSALIPGPAPPNLSKRQASSSRDSYIQQLEQLEQLNMRNMEHQSNGQQQHLLNNILAMEAITSRLPPPSPAPEAPGPESSHNVAAAIKDIRKAIQSTKTLQTPSVVNVTPNMTGGCDPWLPRAGDRLAQTERTVTELVGQERQEGPPPPAPLPPPPLSSCPPSPACSTPPPPPPVELQDESESECGEERVPTPDIMKKEDEDLDTDQVMMEYLSAMLLPHHPISYKIFFSPPLFPLLVL